LVLLTPHHHENVIVAVGPGLCEQSRLDHGDWPVTDGLEPLRHRLTNHRVDGVFETKASSCVAEYHLRKRGPYDTPLGVESGFTEKIRDGGCAGSARFVKIMNG
jgi:hypothetical protein